MIQALPSNQTMSAKEVRLSFPLVGNRSESVKEQKQERFRTSRNDMKAISKLIA